MAGFRVVNGAGERRRGAPPVEEAQVIDEAPPRRAYFLPKEETLGLEVNPQMRQVLEQSKASLGLKSDRAVLRHAVGTQNLMALLAGSGKRLFLADADGRIEAEIDIYPPEGWEG